MTVSSISYHLNGVNNDFYRLGVHQNSAQPSTTVRTISRTLSGSINDWATKKRVTGSARLGATNALCASYMYGGRENHGMMCQDVFVTVNWSVPWSIGRDTRINTSYNNSLIGQSIRFQHQLRNQGPNATSKPLSYATRVVRVKTGVNGVTSTVTPTLQKVLDAYDAHSTSNPTRLKVKGDYAAIPSGRASQAILASYTSFDSVTANHHTIAQADAGHWICSYITVSPSSDVSDSWARSTPACKYIPNTYNLVPSITSVPIAIEAGQNINVRGSVSKSGNKASSSPTNVRYIKIMRKVGQSAPRLTTGTSSTGSACDFYGMTGANASRCTEHGSTMGASFNNRVFTTTGSQAMNQLPDTIPEHFAPGDSMCYGLSVNGYNEITGPSKTGTRYSALQCVVVGKKPKVHISGSDLYIGNSAQQSQVTTSVSRQQAERHEIDAPAESFSGLWLTGVDNNGNKLPNNGFDEHWVIDRVYRPSGYSGDTCQYASTGVSGNGAVIKIPTTSSSTPIRGRVITESGSWAGMYMATDPALTGNLVQSAVSGLHGSSVWNRVSPKARWIGQNNYGQNWAQANCADPTFYYSTDINRANVYVFKLRNGFYIDDPDVKLETARVRIAGAVDNTIKFYVNGHQLGDWQNPGWGPGANATSQTGGPGVFKYGRNDLELHVQSTYSHTGILIDDFRIQAKTLSPINSDEYGSWSEYGAVASGRITGLASAAGYAGGIHQEGPGASAVNFCNLSLLSLSNQNTTDVCQASTVGYYGLPANVRTIIDRYDSHPSTITGATVTPSSLSSGVYRPATVSPLTIQGGTLPAGRSVVIYAPNNDVTINGNLTYTTGALSSAGQVPQLVIIARNITVNESVSQVDAWLVARTTGHGNIYTCNVSTSALRSTNCTNRLTVNGPVISNKIHLRRTAGATRGADAARPAESFNLRPDAYLWGISQGADTGRIPTTMVRELPPRF